MDDGRWQKDEGPMEGLPEVDIVGHAPQGMPEGIVIVTVEWHWGQLVMGATDDGGGGWEWRAGQHAWHGRTWVPMWDMPKGLDIPYSCMGMWQGKGIWAFG